MVDNVPVEIRGVSAIFPRRLDRFLTASEVSRKKLGRSGILKKEVFQRPLFDRLEDGRLVTGLGAFLFLIKNPPPSIRFSISKMDPVRSRLRETRIPPLMRSSPKWKVGGIERFYFHEAMEVLKGNHCGLIRLPTGSGKTAIAIALAYNQAREVGSGLIITPSQIIRDQFLSSAEKWGVRVEDYRSYRGSPPSPSSITVSTPRVILNDVVESLDLRDSFRWIITDEVHHAKSRTLLDLYRSLPNLSRTHGFSARPISDGAAFLRSFYDMEYRDAMTLSNVGPILYQKRSKELSHFLNLPKMIRYPFRWKKEVDGNDYHAILNRLTGNEDRNRFLARLLDSLTKRGRRTVMFVPRVLNGERVLGLCKESKIALWIGGKIRGRDGDKLTPSEIREQFGDRFLSLIMTSSYQMSEGLDLDRPVNTVVLTAGKSGIGNLQQSGRVTRPDEGGSLLINVRDENGGILRYHSTQREKILIEEFNPSMVVANNARVFDSILDSLL